MVAVWPLTSRENHLQTNHQVIRVIQVITVNKISHIQINHQVITPFEHHTSLQVSLSCLLPCTLCQLTLVDWMASFELETLKTFKQDLNKYKFNFKDLNFDLSIIANMRKALLLTMRKAIAAIVGATPDHCSSSTAIFRAQVRYYSRTRTQYFSYVGPCAGCFSDRQTSK